MKETLCLNFHPDLSFLMGENCEEGTFNIVNNQMWENDRNPSTNLNIQLVVQSTKNII